MKLLWLYPDILNLHGDRGNILALLSIAKEMGLATELIKADLAEAMPPLDDVDLIILGAGQLRDMPYVANDLRTRRDELYAYAEAGGRLLAVGSSGCLLGTGFTPDGGEFVEGLGLIDMTARELARTEQPMLTKEVYGDDLYWRSDAREEVIGCQIQRMDFTLGRDAVPLGEVIYGYGNDLSGAEGARRGNVCFTNTVGPLLSCAPWLGVRVLREIADAHGADVSGFREEDVPFMALARASFEKKKAFIRAKKKLPGIVDKMRES